MATIALIYGRDANAGAALGAMLRALGHEVKDFEVAKIQNPNRSFNKDIVDNLFSGVEAAVAALTPDEETQLRLGLRSTSASDWDIHLGLRPNVLLELGMAAAKLNAKVLEVSFGFPFNEIASDWQGLNPIRWQDSKITTSELRDRLNSLGIESADPLPAILDQITYAPLEPLFEDARPPYAFIKYPWRLPQVTMNPIPPNESRAYKDAGFDISTDYIERQVSWGQQGYAPLIVKDEVRREYVLAVFDGGGFLRIWIYRKGS